MAQFVALSRQYRNNEERSDWRADYRTALICALTANIHRDPKKGKAYKPEDFMPKQGKETKPMNEQEMLSQLKLMNASLGGETHGE